MSTLAGRKRGGRGAKLARGAALTVLTMAVASLLFLGVGPLTGRYRVLTMLSGSMAAAIPAGALVVSVPRDPSSIRAGQIVTYERGRSVITHRVVEVIEHGRTPLVRTQGDANATPDPWVVRLSGSTAWRVHTVVPFGGRVVQHLRSSTARNIAVWGAPLALALIWLRDIWRPQHRRSRNPQTAGA